MNILNRLKNLHQGIKSSIAFFISIVVTKGIAYITTPIFTRLLTAEEYGQVAVFLTWVQLFGIVAMFCLSYGVFNNGMVDFPEKRDDYSFSMLILSNFITLFFFFIIFLLYPFLEGILKIDLALLFLMLVLFLVQPAYNFWSSRQRYELKYKWTLFWSIVSAILSQVVAIICILLNDTGNNLYPRILGAEITLIVIYIGFYFYLGCKNSWKLNTTYWKAALLFNFPLIPHYLSTYLLGNSDKLMISYLVNDSATAFYSVAHSVAVVANIVWTAVNGSMIPYTYENCKIKNYRAINMVTLPILVVFASFCVFVIMLAPEVIAFMATNEYLSAIYVVPPIVGGVFFQVQYYLYANIVYYYKRPVYVLCGSLTAMLLNIALNYYFISKYGFIAAGYTTLFCYLLQAIIDFLAMRKIVGQNVYNMKFICGLSFLIIIIALFSNLMYKFTFLRYTIIFVLLIAVMLFKKKIWSYFVIMRKT